MQIDTNRANLLVTGGAGFMGSCFIRQLLKDPLFTGKIVNLDALTYSGNLDNLAGYENDPRYLFVKENILNQKLVEKLLFEEKIDAIVHFAAETHVDRSISDASAFMQTNVLGTAALLEAVRKYPNVHFHHISTDEVYGALGDTGSFSENSSYLPNSPYAASKAASDHFVRAYGKTYGISTTISHAGNNYGPCQYPEKLIPFMLTQLLKKGPLPLYGKGDNVRDWLFVEDHAKAVRLILEKGKPSEVYNIASSQEISNLGLVKLIIKLFARKTNSSIEELESKITFVEDRPGHDYRYSMNTNKIADEVGFVPKYALQEGLSETVSWYLENTGWLKNVLNEEYNTWVKSQYEACK
ncbi:dTDP-glucose 4,6-dehydratase [Candidatus Aerophobetes bacterium]|uniref:dTDP-glucose 4,6-dehydratase n=1 Tax=Aerophobetes bacterium TaxID=2030807 RepID=A0A2A4YDM3_UNCAE|nr:MAG: dTDP-glucose 4,6-dehydratase [Candidatus Aerophobetes bacterium]